jgi:hypothetical protein
MLALGRMPFNSHAIAPLNKWSDGQFALGTVAINLLTKQLSLTQKNTFS